MLLDNAAVQVLARRAVPHPALRLAARPPVHHLARRAVLPVLPPVVMVRALRGKRVQATVLVTLCVTPTATTTLL